jgi:hypothetical protein
MAAAAEIAERLRALPGDAPGSVRVEISYSIIKLLSEQLYASPVKAVEELVVNAWDAEARRCAVFVPAALTAAPAGARRDIICIFDDGTGMGDAELGDLWHVGLSRKRQPGRESKRRQIGKFGIGKLASYAVARNATYFTRGVDGLRSVSIDFDALTAHRGDPSAEADVRLLELQVVKPNPEEAARDKVLNEVLALIGQRAEDLFNGRVPTWTLVILEGLRDESATLTAGRLNWVLSTAMPIAADFELTLNGQPVTSSLETQATWTVNATVAELLEGRLARLGAETSERWWIADGRLYSESFTEGITGTVRVAERSLFKENAKSRDLGRSHGFFIRVRGRLVNEEDPLFGLEPRSFKVVNRLVAELEADDLDDILTAPRESIERSRMRRNFIEVLNQVFGEARVRFGAWEDEQQRRLRARPAATRDVALGVLLERTLSDVAVATTPDGAGWTVLAPPPGPVSPGGGAEDAPAPPAEGPRQLTYRYESLGESAPVVRADAGTGAFTINEDHPLARRFADDPTARSLVELLVTGEAVLEAGLRSVGVPAATVAQVLSRRDALLRALAQESSFALPGLARAVSIATDDAGDLRTAVVASLRAIGFVAREAGDLVEAELVEAGHTRRLVAAVATDADAGDESLKSLASWATAGPDLVGLLVISDLALAVGAERLAARAAEEGVSCWPASALAQLVRAGAARHVAASDVARIAASRHAPEDVRQAVSDLVEGGSATDEQRAAVLRALAGAADGAARRVVPAGDLLAELRAAGAADEADAERALEAVLASLGDRVHLSADKTQVAVTGPIDGGPDAA